MALLKHSLRLSIEQLYEFWDSTSTYTILKRAGERNVWRWDVSQELHVFCDGQLWALSSLVTSSLLSFRLVLIASLSSLRRSSSRHRYVCVISLRILLAILCCIVANFWITYWVVIFSLFIQIDVEEENKVCIHMIQPYICNPPKWSLTWTITPNLGDLWHAHNWTSGQLRPPVICTKSVGPQIQNPSPYLTSLHVPL